MGFFFESGKTTSGSYTDEQGRHGYISETRYGDNSGTRIIEIDGKRYYQSINTRGEVTHTSITRYY